MKKIPLLNQVYTESIMCNADSNALVGYTAKETLFVNNKRVLNIHNNRIQVKTIKENEFTTCWKSFSAGMVQSVNSYWYGDYEFTIVAPMGAKHVVKSLRLTTDDRKEVPEIIIFEHDGRRRFASRSFHCGVSNLYKNTAARDVRYNFYLSPVMEENVNVRLEWRKDRITIFLNSKRVYSLTDADLLVRQPLSLVAQISLVLKNSDDSVLEYYHEGMLVDSFWIEGYYTPVK